jgi:hypothetical protein
MGLSPGLIGALIGLAVGLVQYKIISGIVIGGLRRTDSSKTQEERAAYERRIGMVRAVLVVMTIGVAPVLGYVIGRTLFG